MMYAMGAKVAVLREEEVMAMDWWIASQRPLSLWAAGKVDGKAGEEEAGMVDG